MDKAGKGDWLLFHWSPDTGCVHEGTLCGDVESIRAKCREKGWAFDRAVFHHCWNMDGDKN